MTKIVLFPLQSSSSRPIVVLGLLLCRVTFYGFSMMAFFLVIALLFLVPVENGELPVRARYPFDTTKYPWHAVGFFVEACTISVGMTAIMGMDGLHTNLCNLFLVQLGILSEHFKSCSNSRRDSLSNGDDLNTICGNAHRYEMFSSTAGERNREKDNYEPNECGSFVKQFRRSVRNHQRLLVIIDDFNKIFSVGTFVQILSSTSMICLTGFQAALVTGQSSNIYKFLIYLAAAVSQLFYICWVGNEVMYQSASLTQSQWFSGWTDELSAKTGRLINLSMIFSKRSLNLKAGFCYVLSMETFIIILRSSYSFFALLSTMQSEGDQ